MLYSRTTCSDRSVKSPLKNAVPHSHSFFNQMRRKLKITDHLFPELFLFRGLYCFRLQFLIKEKSSSSYIFLLCELITRLLISFQVLSTFFPPTLSLNLKISQLGLPCMGSQRCMARKLLLITSIWTFMKDTLLHCWGPMELGKLLQCMLLFEHLLLWKHIT